MKIEKLSENQIRCTLTKEDLASRQLQISELAYGTEKAKNLFRDMMRQANHEFGFEAEDMPLMIEAIPMNADSVVLVITKVEDPEELDTRFARFAPSVSEEIEHLSDAEDDNENEASDEIMDLFRKIQSHGNGTLSSPAVAGASPSKNSVFCFESLPAVLTAVHSITTQGIASSLYKDESNHKYLLLLESSESLQGSYQKICSYLSEYAGSLPINDNSPSFLKEHCTCIVKEHALDKLSQI